MICNLSLHLLVEPALVEEFHGELALAALSLTQLHCGKLASSDDDSHCVVTHTGRHGQNGKRLRDCCALPIARGP